MPIEELIAEARAGHETPRRILEARPILTPFQDYFWSAYWVLSSERPPAMAGCTAIPVMKIVDYGRFLRLTDREIDELIRVIMALDTRFVTVQNERAAKQRANG